MSDQLEKAKKQLALELARASGAGESEAYATLESPKNEFGDLASKIAFLMAPRLRKAPGEIAQEVAEKIKAGGFIEKVEAAGPYINVYFNESFYRGLAQASMEAKPFARNQQRVLVEFPSVNPNKPWHLGHLRNALLGDSIARILQFAGFDVTRMDYINDLGLQVAQSFWGQRKKNAPTDEKFDHWLGKEYVEVAQKIETDTAAAGEIREILKKLEEGGNEISRESRKMTEKCLGAQYQTAFRYGIYHNLLIFESDIVGPVYTEGMDKLKHNQAIRLETEGKNAGCRVVDLPPEFLARFGDLQNTQKVLLRSDGTTVYTGKDIIFHLWKFGKLKADFRYSPFLKQPNGEIAYMSSSQGKPVKFPSAMRVVNVVGIEQKYPQEVVREILRRMGYDDAAANMTHLAYERVSLPEGGFSGRAGTWIGYTADRLLEEAQKKVAQRMDLDAHKGKEVLGGSEKKEAIERIALGAIKFSFLRPGGDKRIVFRWEDALNMEGDSGPYLQYAYVRTLGILRKAKGKGERIGLAAAYSFSREERMLIRKLAEFPAVVEKSARLMATNYIAEYLLELSTVFNRFYTVSPVLNAPMAAERESRLAIVQASNETLRTGLELLGIPCLEKM